MRLVLDTNILIAALIRDSTTREILLSPGLDLLLPEYAMEELARHRDKIARYARLKPEEVDLLCDLLLQSVTVVPREKIAPHWKAAEAMMGAIDPDDVPFVALALAERNDGIWSHDRAFGRLPSLKVWNTGDLKNHLRGL